MSTSTVEPLDRRRDSGEEPVSNRLEIHLEITDWEVVTELVKLEDGPERDAYATGALRLGVLTLRQARGELDAQAIRQAGERLVADMRAALTDHATAVTTRVSGTLMQYFDPSSGLLSQRLEQLVRKDGELDALLVEHLGSDGSKLAETLARHVGEHSPLFRLLSPSQSEGLLAALTRAMDEALNQQRDALLAQFSLDSKESALSRLVDKVADTHGRLKEDLRKDLAGVVKEFSLDDPASALSRLVGQVDRAQRGIAEQFSLDLEHSSLSRLKRELMSTLGRLEDDQRRFQAEVRATLAASLARREEAARSTRHGGDFQDALGDVLGAEARRLGDVFTSVGRTTGHIKHCKVGDFLAELNPESQAPGERIVVEAKAAAGYTVAAAREELNTARENRRARVGIFAFAKTCAPDGAEPLARFGEDVIVVWEPSDQATDIYLRAAYSLARCMLVGHARDAAKTPADFGVIDNAIAEIARRARSLEEITTLTQTISSNSSKVLDRIRIAREALEREVETLNEHLRALRA